MSVGQDGGCIARSPALELSGRKKQKNEGNEEGWNPAEHRKRRTIAVVDRILTLSLGNRQQRMKAVVQKKIDEHLEHRGLRMTRQRLRIIDAVFESEEHFTAEELIDRTRKLDLQASRATVYRTLAMLVEARVLGEVDLGKGQRFFDPNFGERPDHSHLVCIDCGRVVEFEDSHLEVLEDCLTRRLGFRPTRRSLRIEACCEQLRKEGICENLIQARVGSRSGALSPGKKGSGSRKRAASSE